MEIGTDLICPCPPFPATHGLSSCGQPERAGAAGRAGRGTAGTVVSVQPGLPAVRDLRMADTKGANISRMMLKQAGRAKEKVSRPSSPLVSDWLGKVPMVRGAACT